MRESQAREVSLVSVGVCVATRDMRGMSAQAPSGAEWVLTDVGKEFLARYFCC